MGLRRPLWVHKLDCVAPVNVELLESKNRVGLNKLLPLAHMASVALVSALVSVCWGENAENRIGMDKEG